MVNETLGTGKSYPSLPIREVRKEKSGRPTINLQMEQMNTQLTQLINHLQRLNHHIQASNDEKKGSHILDIRQVTAERNTENNNYLAREDQLSKKKFRSTGGRKESFSYLNGICVFFLAIGVIAALLAVIILFFRGPAMM